MKADYYPCYMEIEDTEKRGSIFKPYSLRKLVELSDKTKTEK